ncbi:putative C6 transcription factor [Exophiala viscosa]|uniref:putative C6 transcription factor n=1 Tax=Exophiala viscosa TaxID=2486360 RepID=UPI0021A18B45|nr:putative C6 transcription factor [Exophiala viscosa]
MEDNSPAISTPPASARTVVKPQRVLACVLCQQRKVRCDRRFPCANCVKSSAQCVPATLVPRQRRRRVPERELLERLRRYETLLRQNKIDFEPLHTSTAEKTSPNEDIKSIDSPDDGHSEENTLTPDQPATGKAPAKAETVFEARNYWHTMRQRARDHEDEDEDDDDDHDDNESRLPHDAVREEVIKRVFDQLYQSNDHLLFGSRTSNVNLLTLHPSPSQIFRLWQIYLDNVNPLLKVTHTPTLQARIIDAAGNLSNIDPTLEALMFSIYCVSVPSLVEDECRTLFGSSRTDLLTSYQFGCQQALMNCGVLRSSEVDSLTALFLYLVSVRRVTDPRSLSSTLGVAIRIAQRLSIQNESTNAKCAALEAEMRRRLWWSLVMFDNRIGEMSDLKSSMLAPTWACCVPLNINDSDISPEMKIPPAVYDKPTDSIFVVVRSEIADFVRHSSFHLDFTNPSLKAVAGLNTAHDPVGEHRQLATLEKSIEDKYLQFCNPENPLHFMTIWSTRGHFAKCHLMVYYARFSFSSVQETDAQRNHAFSLALHMLECDTRLMASPLIKGYHWLLQMYFPFFAYIHIVQDLKRQPMTALADRAWEIMSDNYNGRFTVMEQDDQIFARVFARVVLQAWEARQAAFNERDQSLDTPRIVSKIQQEPPRIVVNIQQRLAQIAANSQNSTADLQNDIGGMNLDDLPMAMPGFGGNGVPYTPSWPGYAGPPALGTYPDLFGQATMDVDVNPIDWTSMNWRAMQGPPW